MKKFLAQKIAIIFCVLSLFLTFPYISQAASITRSPNGKYQLRKDTFVEGYMIGANLRLTNENNDLIWKKRYSRVPYKLKVSDSGYTLMGIHANNNLDSNFAVLDTNGERQFEFRALGFREKELPIFINGKYIAYLTNHPRNESLSHSKLSKEFNSKPPRNAIKVYNLKSRQIADTHNFHNRSPDQIIKKGEQVYTFVYFGETKGGTFTQGRLYEFDFDFQHGLTTNEIYNLPIASPIENLKIKSQTIEILGWSYFQLIDRKSKIDTYYVRDQDTTDQLTSFEFYKSKDRKIYLLVQVKHFRDYKKETQWKWILLDGNLNKIKEGKESKHEILEIEFVQDDKFKVLRDDSKPKVFNIN